MRRLGSAAPERPSVDGPTVFDTSVYQDPQRYDREIAAILRTGWLVVAHVDELSQVNSWLTWDRFGESIVISRTERGYHAFHNVCRHRGARIASGCGVAPQGRLTCRWHSWNYRLDGSIHSITERDSFDGEPWLDDPAPSVACDVYGGFVWINLAGEHAEDLHSYLGEVATDLDQSQLSNFRFFDKRSIELPVNWKCAIDSFLEAYHVRYLHKRTVGRSLETPGVRYHMLGRHSLLSQPFASGFEDLELDSVDPFAVADNQYFAFPGTTLDMVGGHALTITYLPLDVERTAVEIWQTYVDRPGARDRQQKYLDLFMEIVDEDISILTELSTVTQSSAYRRNYLNYKECRISHFHQQVDQVLAQAMHTS